MPALTTFSTALFILLLISYSVSYTHLAAALLCCVFTGSFRVQAVVFLVVSILCLAAFRPLAAKLRLKHTATNGDRNLGREAIVLSPVTAEVPGRVRLDGVDWNARCATPGDTLGPGSLCRVTEIHSTLLIVEPVLTEKMCIRDRC